jgi:hypothetical protein
MPVDIRQLKEIIQSANINILIGAGASRPYLVALGNIEEEIVKAKNETEVNEQLRAYFGGVMLPSKHILNNGQALSEERLITEEPSIKETFIETHTNYKDFFDSINTILLNRKSTLLHKQTNIFTTNIDLFIEKTLEDSNYEYNDGFIGGIRPSFNTSNFSKVISKTSAHFDNVAEIPVFNVFKLHGSLSWDLEDDGQSISYSDLTRIDLIEASKENNEDFREEYDKLQIVNPTKEKFRETVMGVTHYEMLRMYSDALEKENSVLFVIGFSMADEHIREITKRVANSNPTLKIYIFSFSNGGSLVNYQRWFSSMKYQNVEIVTPNEDENYDLKTVNANFFRDILNYSPNDPVLKEDDRDIDMKDVADTTEVVQDARYF